MRRPPSPAKIPTATQGIRPRPRIGTQLHASHVPGSGRMVKMAAAYSIPSSLLVSLSLWCSVCACLPVLSYPNGYPVLPVTSKRRPDASHSWRPLRVLLYLICVTPLPLPRPAHVINLASPQGQHLSHHSPRHTPKVHLQSSTFYPTSSFRHLGLQSLPTLPPHFRIDFRFLCYAGIASPLLLLLYCRWCPPLAFGELRFALHSCAPPTFHCILAILAQLPYCTTASHPLLATLALHFPSAILATLSHATGCQTDPTSFTAACTPATCLASHAHFHRLLTFLTQALPLLRHTASALPLSALLQL